MNALKELGAHLKKAKAAIKCATITYTQNYGETETTYSLPVNHTLDEFDAFCNQLNFDYNDGYGTQYLTGTIWYQDGTWSERREYDGSEWWSYCSCPAIPIQLFS